MMKLFFILLCLLPALVIPATALASKTEDPHYTDAGFFDIHICNWPDQRPFYMAIFSTARYKDLKSVEVLTPEGHALGNISLKQHKLLKRKNKPEKRVFISNFDLPEHTTDGWFIAKITLHENSEFTAKDYVLHEILPKAQGLQPADTDKDIAMPNELKWDPIPGAEYYRAFIRDLWDSDKLIFSSRLLTETRTAIPDDLLKPGGLYSWKVHARDVNEHIELGDFNKGSNSHWAQFLVSDN